MKTYLYPLIVIFLFSFGNLDAQTRSTYRISADSPKNPNVGAYLYETGLGEYDLITHIRFGIDSGYISLMKLDSNFAPGMAQNFTMSQRLQLNHVAETSDGYVMSGIKLFRLKDGDRVGTKVFWKW